MRQHPLAAATVVFALLWASRAHADQVLDDWHTGGYYLARGGAVAGAMGVTFATMALLHPARPAATASEWLGWDDGVRGRLSSEADSTSDVTLFATLTVPIGAELTEGIATRLANTSILYAEVLWANVLLNTVVKYSAPRLRPYNYKVPTPNGYIAAQGVDAQLSFYSGHASTAFAAAVGGSYLFAAAHPEGMAKSALWGVESAMATATAIWRIRAGKHFYSDVVTGAVIGSALGVGIPLLEGVRHRPSASEMAFAGGGVVLGGLVAIIVPFGEEGVADLGATRLRVKVLPALSDRAAGLTALGSF